VDLGFGDSGKGVLTDFLARALGAHTVVRFNGGAQAGHNVVAPDGRHHTFSQFGAATFVPGLRTHLAAPVVIHPTALLVESQRLASVCVTDALRRLSIDEDCLVTTPMHQAAGRLRELDRGCRRHGTSGVGVGETLKQALDHPEDAVRYRDLLAPSRLRPRLLRLQQRLRDELGHLATLPNAEVEARVLADPAMAERWLEAARPLFDAVSPVDAFHLASVLREPGTVIFEGAQGVLLDEWRGFHPHTTWSRCTLELVRNLLETARYDGVFARLGVLRTYLTRHGEGPFPTEDPTLDPQLPEPHNGGGGWQGPFRRGWPDLLLWRYALAVLGGLDGLAVTHLDALGRVPTWQAARAYQMPDGSRISALPDSPEPDLVHQQRLTDLLTRARPEWVTVELGARRDQSFVEWLEAELGSRVVLGFSGPRAADGVWHDVPEPFTAAG
jgi:adenylosuccinate synthase